MLRGPPHREDIAESGTRNVKAGVDGLIQPAAGHEQAGTGYPVRGEPGRPRLQFPIPSNYAVVCHIIWRNPITLSGVLFTGARYPYRRARGS